MNETTPPDGASDGPWPTRDQRARVPDAAMAPGSENAAGAAVGLLNQAVQGAHDTIDRLADGAAPAAQQLGERVSAAGDAIHAWSDPMRQTLDECLASVRTTVRSNPLASMAVAMALGAVIVRITR